MKPFIGNFFRENHRKSSLHNTSDVKIRCENYENNIQAKKSIDRAKGIYLSRSVLFAVLF